MTIADLERSGIQPSTAADATLSELAAGMAHAAINYCESKTEYRGRDGVVAGLRAEIPHVHDYFRYSLACQIARFLSGLDDNLVGVYTHSWGDAEEEGEDKGCSLAANLCLILHVRRKTAALASLVSSLDQALLDRYKELISPYGQKMATLLDTQVVDDRDVEECVGFGAALRSSHTRPVRVWPG